MTCWHLAQMSIGHIHEAMNILPWQYSTKVIAVYAVYARYVYNHTLLALVTSRSEPLDHDQRFAQRARECLSRYSHRGASPINGHKCQSALKRVQKV